jgi:acyl-CoA synthetase (AMP-forming)/AMP-acid ligase II
MTENVADRHGRRAAGQLGRDERREQVDYVARQGRSMFGVELRTSTTTAMSCRATASARAGSRRAGRGSSSAISRRGGRDRRRQWFDTGDVAAIHPDGTLQITDRSKDVIKSGGEWISSIELENAAVGCPGVPKPRRSASPSQVGRAAAAGLSSATPGSDVCARQDPRASLTAQVAKWWLPDAIEFVDELPHTATGKLSKKDLRDQFRDYRFADAEAMVGRD